MRVHTPTSNVKFGLNVRIGDVLSLLVASPVALDLRDPTLFADDRVLSTLTYCSIGFIAGLLMLIVFRLGKALSDPVSLREVELVVGASLVTAALTSCVVFSLDLFVPRSIPVIHFFVLTSLLLFVRVITTKSRTHRKQDNYADTPSSQHVLIVGANQLACSYIRMLAECNIEQIHIAAILDENPRLFGRSLFGYTVIAPPSALDRVIKEYQVHGVRIDRVLIASNRPVTGSQDWSEIDEYCRNSNISLIFLGDVLGIEFHENSTSRPRC